MRLKDLRAGEAYAFDHSYKQAWARGSARRAYYIGRLPSREGLPAERDIEWFFSRSRPVDHDPEVLVAVQRDLSGLEARRDLAGVRMATDLWRPGVVGRSQLLCSWAEFEERIEKLRQVRLQYRELTAEVSKRLRRAGVTNFEVVSYGSWDVFEPDEVVVRVQGRDEMVLGRHIPAEATIEFKAPAVLNLRS